MAIETLDDAAFEEYELRCLPAGSHFKVSAVDMNGRRIHPLFSGHTGTVLDASSFPATDPDGKLREVLHAVQYDGDATTSTLSDLWMTVAASASAIR